MKEGCTVSPEVSPAIHFNHVLWKSSILWFEIMILALIFRLKQFEDSLFFFLIFQRMFHFVGKFYEIIIPMIRKSITFFLNHISK